MGMNFYDIAIARVHQFDGKRLNYTRKKTESEGGFFSIKQNFLSKATLGFCLADRNH